MRAPPPGRPAARALAGLALILGIIGCGGTRKLLRQAEAYSADGRYTAAVRTYERVLEASPGEPAALVGIARAWLETEEPERAIVPAQVAAETNVPGGKEVSVDALIANGRGASAAEAAQALVQANPKDAAAWARLLEVRLAAGQLQEAVAAAEEVIPLGGGPRALSAAAWAHARAGNCPRATSLAGRASAAAVAEAGVQAEAAAVFWLCAEAERANGTANAARALITDNGALWSIQAKRRAAGGDHEGAVRRLAWLRVSYPEDGTVAARLGSALLKAKEPARAAVELRAALKLSPYANTNQLASGVHVAYRAADQLSEAQRQDAVTAILAELGRAEGARGDSTAAAEALEAQLAASDSRDPLEWRRLAQAWAATNTPGRGVEAARRATDLAPDDFEARLLLAQLLARRGEGERAIGQALMALQLRPGDERGSLLLGNLLLARGDLREARRVYEACLQRYPNTPAVREALRRLPAP
jgi:tetratricopeptide (TPR) repeat protein